MGRALARAGGIVVGTATSTDGAQSISDYLADTESKGSGAVLDVTNTEAVNALVSDITQAQGAPTILVNNAGITRDNLLLRMKEEDWDAVMATNLKGPFLCIRAAVQRMKGKPGRIVNISAITSQMGRANAANYSASKGGLDAMTRALAVELAPDITINSILLGFFDSPLVRQVFTPAQIADAQRGIPAARLGRFAEVSAMVQYLASDAAGFITGQSLSLDGGQIIRMP